jgi:hypothetical protein
LDFIDRTSKNPQISGKMQNNPVAAKAFHKGRREKGTVVFGKFIQALKKLSK